MPKLPPKHKPATASRAGGVWEERNRIEAERKAEYDKKRPSSAARGYDRRWAKARKGFLMRHPICAACNSLGVVTAATVVDHIKPHKGDKALFWDRDNWQPLCKPCHDRKTAKEGRWG